MQFGELMQKEAQKKIETVNNVEKKYNVDNDLSKNRNNKQGNKKQNNKQSKTKKELKCEEEIKSKITNDACHFDQKV